jgi:hypothetical protein
MKNLAKIFLFAFLFGIFSITPKVFADSVSPVSVSLTSGFPISETNLAPGDIIYREFTVTKNDDTSQDLMILFSETPGDWITGSYDLKDRMTLKIQKPNGSFSTLPNGKDEELLKDIYLYQDSGNSNAFKFDTVTGNIGQSYTYKLQFAFDPLAGNEFQAKKTVFGVSVGIFSQPPSDVITTDNDDGEGDDGGRNGGRRNLPVTGIIRTTNPAVASVGQVGGAEIPSEETIGGKPSSEVEGVEVGCSEWPFWVWILILIGYVAILNTNFYYKLREKVRWFLPMVWTSVIFLVWYYFEKCRLYPWYPYAILIIAILSFFVYLSWFRKKMRQEIVK